MTLGEALGAAIAAYRDKRNEDCAAALVRVIEITEAMTDATTPRVTDERLRTIVNGINTASPYENDHIVLDLRDSRALAQSQAATIAERNVEIKRLKHQSDDWQKRGWELGNKLDVAESAIAALAERLARAEAALRDARIYITNFHTAPKYTPQALKAVIKIGKALNDPVDELESVLAALTATKET